MTTTEPNVIFNDSSMYASNIEWRTDIKEEPINDYEKNMISHTKNTNQLLDEEKEENPLELSDEQREKIRRRDYITRVKVVSLHNIGKHPLFNASYLSQRDKRTLIKQMEEVMKLSDDEIIYKFNEVCNDELFNIGSDVSTYPVYNIFDITKSNIFDINKVNHTVYDA